MEDFDALYRRYLREVYRYLLKLCGDEHIAEELTQSAFMVAFEKLESFRGESRISVWLCQIAKYEYYNWRRKNRKYSDEEPVEQESGEYEPLGYILRKEENTRLYKVLQNLMEPYKEVFLLRTLEEMSYRDIGKKWGKSESWARVTYYRARKMIVEYVEEREKREVGGEEHDGM